ncbi:hypothetical protein V7S43_003996 [Phytophthora oleae]|uniref:Uncharacterized protein n=1 Tax=Phytophthora oleae TaxID=2107226 RepID=A0ABD3FYI8_9STRA
MSILPHTSKYTAIMNEDFAAMMAAIVINQTAKKFSIRAEKRTIMGGKPWKWIAYGLFSKRAPAYSTLEYAALNQIDSLTDLDVEAFVAVLNSDHPEEELCGTPAGVVEERNATLKAGASIRWKFSQGQLVVHDRIKPINIASDVRCVRTFSDDGDSEWVYAMIPSLGRCQVQRDDLVFDFSGAIESRPGALKSLALGFNKEEDTYPVTNGVPQFLAAIGSTLKELTLDGPRDELGENVIVRHCPNLHRLSLCGGIIDVQLDFSHYRYDNLPVPELKCNWHDVRALAADLGDLNNPFSKIVPKLRIRLNDKCKRWRQVAGGYNFDKLPGDIKALLGMLTANRHLAYLDVLMLTEDHKYGNGFKKQHRKPIDISAKLPRNVKLAFLSVISARTAPASNKRARRASQATPMVGGLDERVVSKIFSFTGPPQLRRVYFRTTKHYWEPYFDLYGDLDEDDEFDDDEEAGDGN